MSGCFLDRQYAWVSGVSAEIVGGGLESMLLLCHIQAKNSKFSLTLFQLPNLFNSKLFLNKTIIGTLTSQSLLVG